MTKWLSFGFQVIMAWVYMIPQVLTIARGETKGLTLVLYIGFLVYCTMSLWLAISSYKEVPTDNLEGRKARKLVIIIFLQWTVFMGILFTLGIDKIIWHSYDPYILGVMAVLSVCTFVHYKGVKDPYSRGFMSVWYKSVPQVWLAITIFMEKSSEGLPLVTLLAGHATSLPRLYDVWSSGRKTGWDRPTEALFFGELANVGAWTIVTILWYIFHRGYA